MISKIEWTQETWNPITGCLKISEGCKNCYAERMARRLAGRYGYQRDDPFKPTFHDDRLAQPLKWRKPRRIFVASMGDVWAMSGWPKIDEIFYVCHQAPQHTYMFLTKRIEAAWYYFNSPIYKQSTMKRHEFLKHDNIYLGVTAENQKRADERIPILLQIPAKVRFVSVEPMLGPVNISKYFMHSIHCPDMPRDNEPMSWAGSSYRCKCSHLDWVICGCESGPGRRDTEWEWIDKLCQQCHVSNTPFFLKQAENADGTIDKMPQCNGMVWDQYPIN